jgi:hypothetical protein
MANATVRLVIVGRKKEIHRSIVAFQDELLNNLGWFGSIDFFVHAANNDPANLQSAANKAVADAQAALTAPQAAPAAVVAGGVQATSCLQIAVQNSAGPTVPIIQAVGGAVPPNPQNYVTGFIINALATAEYHLDHVPSQSVTVLYDDTPGTPSLDVYNNLFAYNQAKPAPQRKAITPLPARTPRALRTLDPTKLTTGFMLIPNAMFYNHCDDIAAYVDGQSVGGTPVSVFYPEREYKKAHTHTATVKVYGYNIPLTYRLAAQYVDKILDGATVAQLGGFLDAVPDRDPGLPAAHAHRRDKAGG